MKMKTMVHFILSSALGVLFSFSAAHGNQTESSEKILNTIFESRSQLSISRAIVSTHSWQFVPEMTEASRYEASIENNTVVQRLLVGPKGLKDLSLVLPDLLMAAYVANIEMTFMDFYGNDFTFGLKNPLIHLEVMTNMNLGSATARVHILELKRHLLLSTKLSGPLSEYSEKKQIMVSELNGQIDQALIEAKKEQRQNQAALKSRRDQSQELEKLEMLEKKLNHYILENDRSAVARMLEAYLPWEVMEPVEKATWKLWIEAIEYPSKDVVVGFRGVDYETDKLQRGTEGHIGMLSTVLTANQGSFTRRLRSLGVNRLTNGAGFQNSAAQKDLQVLNGDPEYRALSVPHSKMHQQFLKHSQKPIASSFLSFTLDPHIAISFVGKNTEKFVNGKSVDVEGGGVVIVKVDRRRAIHNIASSYVRENEFLVPLIIFPDEIIGYQANKVDGSAGSKPQKKFLEKRQEIEEQHLKFIEKTLGEEYAKYYSVKSKTQGDFVSQGHAYSAELMSYAKKQQRSCSRWLL